MEPPTMEWIAVIERLGSIGLLFVIFWRLPSLIEMYNKGIRETMATVQKIQDDALKHSDTQLDKLIASFTIRFERIETSISRLIKISLNEREHKASDPETS